MHLGNDTLHCRVSEQSQAISLNRCDGPMADRTEKSREKSARKSLDMKAGCMKHLA